MADVVVREDEVAFLGVVMRHLGPAAAVGVQAVRDEHCQDHQRRPSQGTRSEARLQSEHELLVLVRVYGMMGGECMAETGRGRQLHTAWPAPRGEAEETNTSKRKSNLTANSRLDTLVTNIRNKVGAAFLGTRWTEGDRFVSSPGAPLRNAREDQGERGGGRKEG